MSSKLENTFDLETLQERIKRGERTRILFEIFLSELGASQEDNIKEVVNKMKDVQEDYEQAIKNLSLVIKSTHQKEGVSVSN